MTRKSVSLFLPRRKKNAIERLTLERHLFNSSHGDTVPYYGTFSFQVRFFHLNYAGKMCVNARIPSLVRSNFLCHKLDLADSFVYATNSKSELS